MSIRVKEIVDLINQYAPNELSFQWDNTGLLIGELSNQVRHVLVTLDVTEKIIDYAIENNFDMIVSHHPFIFKPIKKINDPNIIKLIKHSVSVFAAHTNLDLVKKGVNFALAKKLNLKNLNFINQNTDIDFFHISVFIPIDYVEAVKKAVFNNGGGVFGDYQHCSSEHSVDAQFMPHDHAKPFFGSLNNIEKAKEIKLEFFADSIKLKNIINAIHNCHPYETPTYTINKLQQNSPNYGLGLFGDLENKMTLRELSEFTKEKLNAPFVKLWTAGKNENTIVSKIAICGGSGSSLLPFVSNADCFISGDFTYHQILDSKTPLIDAGHYYTEAPILEELMEMLSFLPIHLEKIQSDNHDIQKLKLI